MTRIEWLKTLKPGDEVANKRRTYDGEISYSFFEVKKITPKGQIRLTNDILLDQNGKYYKYVRFGSSISYEIEPITEEILQHQANRKMALQYRIAATDILEKTKLEVRDYKFTNDELQSIIKFLDNMLNKTGE